MKMANKMNLSEKPYHRNFYSKEEAIEFIRTLWRTYGKDRMEIKIEEIIRKSDNKHGYCVTFRYKGDEE
jgi:hypothetical protein